MVSDAFAQSQTVPISVVMSVRSSECMTVAATARISVTFGNVGRGGGRFMKIFRQIPNLVKIGRRHSELCMQTAVRLMLCNTMLYCWQ